MNRQSYDHYVFTCQGLLRSIAWKIHRGVNLHIELDDLIGYGQIGLIEAARDFDDSRGVQFTTYAYYRIRGAIFDGLSKMSWFNHVDYNKGRFEQMAHGVLEESTSKTDDALQHVKWFKETVSGMAMVYLFCHLQDQTGGRTPEFCDGQRGPEEKIDVSDTFVKLNELIDRLPTDARELIRATYFEGCTLKEAGERIGRSRAWASRMHTRALQDLARGLSETK
ncbi:MAG: sigma-70 family RNA polymerase sigma factor [Planctomycetaceae bacterium]